LISTFQLEINQQEELMAYVQGFVFAGAGGQERGLSQGCCRLLPRSPRNSAPTRMVEAWGDDVPEGKVTDFKGAVKAKPDDEVVVFSAGSNIQHRGRRAKRPPGRS
jgi:uncharacterized protein YbaA (DUF1428 family)